MHFLENQQFPSFFAKEQNIFKVKTGEKIHLFDLKKQFVTKVSFNVGEIETYGLPTVLGHYYPDLPYQPYETEVKYPVSRLYSLESYVNRFYNAEERVSHASKFLENTRFSLRTLDAPNVEHKDSFGNNLYNDNDTQLVSDGYKFLIDQLVYDPQLRGKVFLKDSTQFDINIKSDAITNITSAAHPVFDVKNTPFPTTGVNYTRDSFVPYAQQKAIAEQIMNVRPWLKRYADKHYLILFKPNNVDENPKVLFGVTLSSLREYVRDDTKP